MPFWAAQAINFLAGSSQTLNLLLYVVAWDVFYGIHMIYKLLDSAKKNEQGAASKTGIKL
jgi:hypothetical protein